MSFDMEKILASKRALRRDLANRPIAEKLRMLDALRERELAIRGDSNKKPESNAKSAEGTFAEWEKMRKE
jgi:hypothetical protein